MGLALEVGILADLRENDLKGYEQYRTQFEAVNAHLRSVGLTEHAEPETGAVWSCEMYGYSGLHYLRRIAAHLDLGHRLPGPGGDQAAEDPMMEKVYALVTGDAGLFDRLRLGRKLQRSYDHLLLHSDAEGFYLPIDFDEVQFPDDQLEIDGGMVGSAARLLEECKRLAQVLDIPENLDPQSDALWEAADSQGEGARRWQIYGIESFTCVCLAKGAEEAIRAGAALVFC